jgi:hypothetical protein
MSLPFQKHLEWLCLEGMTRNDITRFYGNVQLPIPTDKDIETAEDSVSQLTLPPAIKRNMRRGIFKIEDSPIWDKYGFGDLHRWRCYRGTKSQTDVARAWEMVGKILNHPVMRISIDACLISHMEEEKMIVLLPAQYHLPINERALDLYRRYFAAFEDFDRAAWSDYLNRIREDGFVYSRVFAALTKPRAEVMHLCGLPTERQFSDFLKNVLATSSYKFDYYMRQNSPDGDTEARRWAKVGFEAGEKFEKYGAGDVTDFAKLVQTEFEYVDSDIKTLSPEQADQMRPAQLDGKVDGKPG